MPGPLPIERLGNGTVRLSTVAPDRYARLQAALDVAAHLVRQLGTDYLPFFISLESELAAATSEAAALQRCLNDSPRASIRR